MYFLEVNVKDSVCETTSVDILNATFVNILNKCDNKILSQTSDHTNKEIKIIRRKYVYLMDSLKKPQLEYTEHVSYKIEHNRQ